MARRPYGINPSTRFQGPVTGSARAGGGVYADNPIGEISHAMSRYSAFFQDFSEDVADIAAMETLGWTETAVGAAAANSLSVTKENGYLLVDAGTAADTGTNLQMIGALASVTGSTHQAVGPLTSTTTLMDNKEIIFSTRIAYAQGAGRWQGATGSKFVIGWVTTDATIMTATTGALSLATGGGIFFHVTEAGALNFVTQRTTTANSVNIVPLIADATSATVPSNWMTLGFRAAWRDASDNASNGKVEAYLNGRLVATVVNDLPMSSAEDYSVSIEVVNGPAASPNIDLAVDYIYTAITRPGMPAL